MKIRYKNICKAILRESRRTGTDERILIRGWIELFEKTRVVGWSRDEFLDCMIKVKKEDEETNK